MALRWQILVFAAAASFVTAFVSGRPADDRSEELAAATRTYVPLSPPRPLGAFSLRDHRGEPFDEGRLRGRFSLVFLGYTRCPDVCPTTLGVLAPALDRIGDAQVVFVSVDPEHDDVDRVRAYVSAFHPRLIGVTGSRDALTAFTAALGGRMAEGEGARIDHPTCVFVFDDEARVVATLLRPSSPSRIVRELERARAQTRAQTRAEAR